MRLELTELVRKEAPAMALGVDFALDGRAAVDAADEPVEHAQRRRAAQAVRPRDGSGRRADRPAVLEHAGLAGAPPASVTARRRAPAFHLTLASHPPLRPTLRTFGPDASARFPCERGCEHPRTVGTSWSSAPHRARSSFPRLPCPPSTSRPCCRRTTCGPCSRIASRPARSVRRT